MDSPWISGKKVTPKFQKLLLPPTIKKEKKVFANVAKDVFFLSFFQIGTNLAQYTSDVATCGNRPQPFVLVIGERTSPSQGESYVIVEGQAMKAESLLKAVDVCFKFMYVLDMHYPTQCTTT